MSRDRGGSGPAERTRMVLAVLGSSAAEWMHARTLGH
jgi:hypothetical protein